MARVEERSTSRGRGRVIGPSELRWLIVLLSLLGQTLLPSMLVQAQSESDCDALSQQIDFTTQDLDQLKNDSLPWLMQASQFGAIAPSDLLVAAEGGLPGLDPGSAASFGAIAAQVGVAINAWRQANQDASSADYWQQLQGALATWQAMFGPLAPHLAGVPSLTGMSTAFDQLNQLASKASADQGVIDSLSQSLQQCEAPQKPPPSPPMPVGGDNTEALCSVGGTAGYSNSQCFTLELDAAFAVWTACTEAYFAAERAAFASGGDLPANNCDGPYNQATEELQRKWGGTP